MILVYSLKYLAELCSIIPPHLKKEQNILQLAQLPPFFCGPQKIEWLKICHHLGQVQTYTRAVDAFSMPIFQCIFSWVFLSCFSCVWSLAFMLLGGDVCCHVGKCIKNTRTCIFPGIPLKSMVPKRAVLCVKKVPEPFQLETAHRCENDP